MTSLLDTVNASRRLRFLFSFFITSLYHSTVLGVVPGTPTPPPVSLTITVTKRTSDVVRLSWQSYFLTDEQLGMCTFHYGPASNTEWKQIKFCPTRNTLAVGDLQPRIQYRGYIICQKGHLIMPSKIVDFALSQQHLKPQTSIKGHDIQSSLPTQNETTLNDDQNINTEKEVGSQLPLKYLQAQNGSDTKSVPSSSSFPQISSSSDRRTQVLYTERKNDPEQHSSSNSYPSIHDDNEEIFITMDMRHRDRPKSDPHTLELSPEITLGIICGVVGFLIINITMVMVLRQLSFRRARQRRMLELQLEQHGGLIYDVENVI